MRDEIRLADIIDDEAAPLQFDDFLAYLPRHEYIFVPTREMWPAKSVDARLPMRGNLKPSAWLDENRAVMQLTWAPGEPPLIADKVIDNGGFADKDGSRIFNSYRSPLDHPRGVPTRDVTTWLDHIEKLYGDLTAHIVHWFAHRVQHPGIKINHALVLGGEQGIGKDTILEPVRRAVGEWNCASVSPKQAMGRFNKFLKSVLLVINEGRDLGEFDRFAFYDHLKTIIAAPPPVQWIDEKRLGEYPVPNVTGVILTTNHKSDGIYLAPDDRRHFVAWSDLTKADFTDEYWRDVWRWYDEGGYAAIAHYLATLNLVGFNPKAPPKKTEAFYAIVNTNRSAENAELADLLDDIRDEKQKAGKTLDTITLRQLIAKAEASNGRHTKIACWVQDAKTNARRIPHRLEECGFVPVRNPDADDGLWRIDGRRQAIYARKSLNEQQRLEAVQRRIEAIKKAGASAA
ncbi:primase-helicase family protein [Bradyrhizobium sp. 27S5]|uniref:primase-helicase family protein n=1 Tax=Bradyrhizobium sp. 27S5 TaxID=3139728 RepID=UPI0030CF061D